MKSDSHAKQPNSAVPGWYAALSQFDKISHRKAIWQLVNTLIPYLMVWGLSIAVIKMDISRWFLVPLWILGAGFLVRIFIFFHDCTHRSFFRSRKANSVVGHILGALTFTAYHQWRKAHWRHHATAGDLDRRGAGDVWTMTLEEYQAAGKKQKLAYRLYRNPFIMLVLGPAYSFLIKQRFFTRNAGRDEKKSVLITNLIILAIMVSAYFTIGLGSYLLIQIPAFLLAGSAGIWLFYVQHQYEDVYWANHTEWDPMKAALDGSSYFKLPGILRWFSGNIGFHHIHHLIPSTPNYNLPRIWKRVPEMQKANTITLWQSFKLFNLHVWDEAEKKLKSFRAVKRVSPA